jgi:hypothetical protein
MRVNDYELSNLILRIEQDKDFKPKDHVINLAALRDLISARIALQRTKHALRIIQNCQNFQVDCEHGKAVIDALKEWETE